MNSLSPQKERAISDEEIGKRLKKLGEIAAPEDWIDPFPVFSTNGTVGEAGNPSGLPRRRALRNIWLTRNEGERRFGQLLLLAGYFHAVVSFILFFGLLSRFPSEGVPVWLRLQAVIGLGLGIFLLAGGFFSLFMARDATRAARFVLSLYLVFLFGEGVWLYHRAFHSFGMLYPWVSGLLTFLTVGTVCNVRPQGRRWRRRRVVY
jgi:hypothetical protein